MILVTASVTSFGRGEPPVYLDDRLVKDGRKVLQFGEEFSKPVVVDLLSESLRDSLKIEVFEAKHVVLAKQVVCKLPLEVVALPGDASFDARLGDARLLLVARSLFLPIDASRSSTELRRNLFEEERRRNVLVIAGDEECFHSEVVTHGFTRLDYELERTLRVRHNDYPKISHGVSLHGKGLHLPDYRSGLVEPVPSRADADVVTLPAVTGLGEGERTVLLDRTELGWTCLFSVLPLAEEIAIGFVHPKYHVLHGLGGELPHPGMRGALDLGDMLLQSIFVQGLVEQLVVPSVHRYAIIPKRAECIDLPIEASALGIGI